MYDGFLLHLEEDGSLRGFFPENHGFYRPHALHPGNRLSWDFFPFISPKFVACCSSVCGHCSPLSSFLYTSNLISGGRAVACLPGMAAVFPPFGSHNDSPFEDETPVLVAFSEEPFYRGEGAPLSVSARLSPVTLKPTHPHGGSGTCRDFLSRWLAVAPAAHAQSGPLAGPAL